MSLKCINNFIDFKRCAEMCHTLASIDFPWYRTEYRNSLSHMLIEKGKPLSSYLDILRGFPEDLRENIIQAQCFIMYRTDKIENLIEKDFDIKHDKSTNLIYHLNSCNGETQIGSISKFKSVANRAIICSSQLSIKETNCTDEDYRLIMYIKYSL
jgi:hypothetical protein